jgi:altronate dehydratase small subunit
MGETAADQAQEEGTATTRHLVQQMHPTDNVAAALGDLAAGTRVRVPGTSADEVVVRQNIPFGHKLALRAIVSGAPVLKYGEVIGLASQDIAPGEHVHTHNVDSQRGRGDLSH